MITLDLRTVLTGYLVTSVICMLVMASLWRQNRTRFAGLGWWMAEFVMQTSGLLLLMLRDAVPDVLSMVVGSGLIVGGTPVLYAGLCAHVGKPHQPRGNLALMALFLLIQGYFSLVQPNLVARNVGIAVFLFIFCLLCAVLLLRLPNQALRRAAQPVGWVVAGFCAVSLVRVVAEGVLPPAHHMFEQGAYLALVLMTNQMLYIGLTFALFMLVNRQLVSALGAELAALKTADEALRASEARLQQAERDAKSGHWELHIDTRLVIGSAGAQAIYGLHGNNFDYSTIKDVPLPAYRPALDAAMQGLLEGRAPYDLDIQIRTADTGAIKDVHSSATFHKDKRMVFGILQDVTERKAADHQLKLAASVFTHASEGITITDATGTIIDVNAAFTRITGYSPAEAVGQNPRILKSGRHPPAFYQAMWHDLIHLGNWSGEIWNRRKSGAVYAEMLTISGVRDATGTLTHYVALFSDITLMKAHESELERLAHLDPLTQLPNRTLLAERLHNAMVASQQRTRALAVVFLDLDGFKGVNDTHGHDAGDELLIALTNRLKGTLREGDTLARMGGDEFVALLTDLAQPQDCEPVLMRMLQAVAEPVRLTQAVVQVSASIGVTHYPQDNADADTLLAHADQAMYTAKHGGRNRYAVFAPTP